MSITPLHKRYLVLGLTPQFYFRQAFQNSARGSIVQEMKSEYDPDGEYVEIVSGPLFDKMKQYGVCPHGWCKRRFILTQVPYYAE